MAKTSQRFGLSEDEVRDEIAKVQAERSLNGPPGPPGPPPSDTVKVSATVKKAELHTYLLATYDKLAQSYGFDDMVVMMATAHVKLVANAIAKPESFGKEGLKSLEAISRMLYPTQKASVTRRLPAGETKHDVLQRLFKRMGGGVELTPGTEG